MHGTVFYFTVLKYLYFVLNFFRGVLVAKVLGPEYYGVLGFWQMVQTYIGYGHLGIPYSVNLELALHRDGAHKYVAPGFWLVASLSLAIFVITSLSFYFFNFGYEYYSSRYGFFALIGGILLIFREFFIDIHQVFGNLYRIVIGDILTVVVLLLLPLFFSGETLIYYSLLGFCLSSAISLLFLIRIRGVSIVGRPEFATCRTLLVAGVPMFAASMITYFATLIPRAVLSLGDDNHRLGLFTLSVNIANAVMLGINSISWAIYPKLLAKTNIASGQSDLERHVSRAMRLYPVVVAGVVIFSSIGIKLLMVWLPQYEGVEHVVSVMLLSQIIVSLSFGPATMLYSNKLYNNLMMIGVLACSAVFVSSVILYQINVNLIVFATCVAIGYIVYSFFCLYIYAKKTGSINWLSWTQDNISFLLIVVVAYIGSVLHFNLLILYAGLFLIFLLSHYRDLFELRSIALSLYRKT